MCLWHCAKLDLLWIQVLSYMYCKKHTVHVHVCMDHWMEFKTEEMKQQSWKLTKKPTSVSLYSQDFTWQRVDCKRWTFLFYLFFFLAPEIENKTDKEVKARGFSVWVHLSNFALHYCCHASLAYQYVLVLLQSALVGVN